MEFNSQQLLRIHRTVRVAYAPRTQNGKILTLGRAKTSLIVGFFRGGCRREQLQPSTGQAESRLP